MIYGVYLSAQGANVQSTRLDVISNNLANASTSSFKRDLAVFREHKPHDVEHGTANDLHGNLNTLTGGVSLSQVTTDFSNGPIVPTGGTFDVALAGPGFLQVSDGRQQYLTRNGRLTMDEDGFLVTGEGGLQVMSASGVPIRILSGSNNVEISSDGTINEVREGGSRIKVDQLDLVQPDSLDHLEKLGDGLYRAHGNVTPAGKEVQVRQGYIEASGTNSISEMTELIEASRAFETNINMMKFQDESLGRLLQSVPRR